MKIVRSVKCSLKFLTDKKKVELQLIRSEHEKVVNKYIALFWGKGVINAHLKKDLLDQVDSWFTQRMKQQSAREAVGMIAATVNRDGDKAKMPVHKGKSMRLSSAICELSPIKNTTHFDSFLQMRSIGDKIKLDIPIKFHRRFNKWSNEGKLLKSFVITKEYVQFSFQMDTGEKKPITNCLGIDTGINCLASLSTGEQIGKNMNNLINTIKKRKSGSKGSNRAITTLKSYISLIAKDICRSDVSLVVVENLKNITKSPKLNKTLRSTIGKWNVSYWLDRLQKNCEENRVSFRRVSPYLTSQTCNHCGAIDKKSRNKQEFRCTTCNHSTNADINAAKNILDRFLTGKYGSGTKTETPVLLLSTIV